MKKKALVLAVCMAVAAPTISVAKAFPSNLVGLSLGEIQSSSHLHEPFKAIIPILFTDAEQSRQLKVRLAPESVFKQIGAEKLPVLNKLRFQISIRNDKPVILVSSRQSIQIPFLNFVLEVEGPKGRIYQDYTALLDPADYQASNTFSYIPNDDAFFTHANDFLAEQEPLPERLEPELELEKLQSNLLLSAYSSPRLKTGNPTKYRVKAGDSVSQIAQLLNTGEVSLKRMIKAIHYSNPNAFVDNNINRLIKGAVLRIPALSELKRFDFKTAKKEIAESIKLENSKKPVVDETQIASKSAYKVKRGDSLSKIAKKFVSKDLSLTKMMTLIHSSNPHAFSNNNINILKSGAILSMPSFDVGASRKEKAIVNNAGQSSQAQSKAQAQTKAQAPGKIQTQSKAQAGTQNGPKPVSTRVEIKKTGEFIPDGYTVKKGDTLAQLVKEIGYKNVSFTRMMKAIYASNPHAFLKSNVTILKEGAVIQLPPLSKINEMVGAASAKTRPSLTTAPAKKLNAIEKNKGAINKLEKKIRELRRELVKSKSNVPSSEVAMKNEAGLDKSQKTGGYTVKKGDTLARVVKKIGHKNVSFTKMMKAVYSTNQHAFLKSNITRLKEGAVIHVPSLSEINGTASIAPSQQLKALENNKRVSRELEKRLRELRRELGKAKSSLSDLELATVEKDSRIDERNSASKSAINQTKENNSAINVIKEAKPVVEENPVQHIVLKEQTQDRNSSGQLTAKNIVQEPLVEETIVKDLRVDKGQPSGPDTLVMGSKGYNIPGNVSLMAKEAVLSHVKSMSNKDLAYSAMALFLGLLLIRYRKQLYGYVSISYDQPKYYIERRSKPRLTPQEATNLEKEEEKEVVNFHETLVDLEEEDIEISEDFLHECEHLAEDLYNNEAYAEIARDKFSNSNIDMIKAEMENETSGRIEPAEGENEGQVQDETDATVKFEEITLDLFEGSEEEHPHNINPVIISEDVEPNEKTTIKPPKTDWETLLENADKQLAESVQVAELDEAPETDPETPVNIREGSFESIEIIDLDTVDTGDMVDTHFTSPQKIITDKFEEAVTDEISFYDEYCRNQSVLDSHEQLAPV